MAVEFRCPDCKAKLRLAEAPPPGEEIECPKCGNLFAAPRSETESRPVRKRRPSEEEDEDEPKPRSKKPAAPEPKAEDKPKDKPKEHKKRKVKKKKANTGVLIGACVGGALAVLVMIGILAYLLTRQPPAVALMAYLPDDARYAYGINYSQLQKYIKFYKDFETTGVGEGASPHSGFAPITKALGIEFNDLVDYLIGAGSRDWTTGEVLLLKTKAEFDPGKLASLDARPEVISDIPVYNIPASGPSAPRSQFEGGFAGRVFAPTNRIIVLVPRNTPTSRIQQMMGPKSGGESFVEKAGPLGKRVARGNVWWFTLENRGRPGSDDPFVVFGGVSPPDTKGAPPSSSKYALGKPQGYGFRANLRSKTISFEAVFWWGDAEKAATTTKTYDESDLALGDEGTQPGTYTDLSRSLFADKILMAQILGNLSFSASGELFLVRTEGDVAKIQQQLGGWISDIKGNSQ